MLARASEVPEHCTEPLNNEWSQARCLMTRLPAAPAMTDLAGAILPDVPDEVGGIVAGRPLVANAVADARRTGRDETTAVPRARGRVAGIAAAT